MRQSRVGRVRRRYDAAGIADLIERMENVAPRTLALARQMFPLEDTAPPHASLPARMDTYSTRNPSGTPSTSESSAEGQYYHSGGQWQALHASSGHPSSGAGLRSSSPSLRTRPSLGSFQISQGRVDASLLPPLPSAPVYGRSTSPAQYALSTYRSPGAALDRLPSAPQLRRARTDSSSFGSNRLRSLTHPATDGGSTMSLNTLLPASHPGPPVHQRPQNINASRSSADFEVFQAGRSDGSSFEESRLF